MAYQGFASGDLERDSFSLKLFAQEGIQLALAQSFSKNFGLYGQRIGTLSIITSSSQEAENVLSQIRFIARAQYSNPVKYGAVLLDVILSSTTLRNLWLEEMKGMSKRIKEMRNELHKCLSEQGSERNWDFLVEQIGMFGYCGFPDDVIDDLKRNYNIYMVQGGRISIAGLNHSNVKYVAESFHKATLKNKI
jgi:aspartate aminotransferase, mitochondrial